MSKAWASSLDGSVQLIVDRGLKSRRLDIIELTPDQAMLLATNPAAFGADSQGAPRMIGTQLLAHLEANAA